MMIDFCKQYGELFNDNEFNLYESSKDDDSEVEPDGDNENNNHDDEGALTADANRQKESDNQKKKKNKEEIDKQPEESGSEGTEESGNDIEVTVQMDDDNQNEELNKEKDGNENEDNDKMNNNEMKNDSDQVKQDADKDKHAEKEKVEMKKEKQDKADKVDNVQEKQDDDKDEIGDDEFWNTQFTDSQCEEMENQAKKKLKRRKQQRETTKGNAVQDEMMIYTYLFSMEGSKFDFIFEMKEGNATIRDYMQTLAPTLKIESNVIDTYCLVLNHEQGMNNKGKKTKHFFHKGMITKNMFDWKKEDGKKYDEVKQYKAFSDTMKNEFKKDDEVKKLKDKEMHPRAKEVLNKKPTILRPKWGTEENNTDCGVFLMMHMENYNGENARNWNPEFPTEE
ncbi:ulp1 protease family, C-terminal catalytic domain-containing protein [Tanacetum coccineum]